MSEGKIIVLTTYGKDKSILYISACLFDSRISADNYCDNINDFQLQSEQWVYAQVVNENEKIEPVIPECMDLKFLNACSNDVMIQTLVRLIDNKKWAIALHGIDEGTKEKILSNMTKRRRRDLEMEIMSKRAALNNEIHEARRDIIQYVRKNFYRGIF